MEKFRKTIYVGELPGRYVLCKDKANMKPLLITNAPVIYHLKISENICVFPAITLPHQNKKALSPFYDKKIFLAENECKTPIGCLIFILCQKYFL